MIALAALAARTRRNVLALSLAVLGVYLLTDVRLVAEPVGIAFAAANAVLFAGYIVLGHRVSRNEQLPGIDGLALSMMIAAVVALPVGITDAAPAFTDLGLLAAAIGVVVLTQIPTAPEVIGVALVVAGVALHRERPAEPSTAEASTAAA